MRPNFGLDVDPRRMKPPQYAPPQGGPGPIDQPGGVTVQPGGGMPMMPKPRMPFATPGLAPPAGDMTLQGSMGAGAPPDISALIAELMNRQAPRGQAPSPVARLLGGVGGMARMGR